MTIVLRTFYVPARKLNIKGVASLAINPHVNKPPIRGFIVRLASPFIFSSLVPVN